MLPLSYRIVIALLIPLATSACTRSASTTPGAGPACTTEAVRCPDGSFVGRSGPRCELAPCPAAPEPLPPERPSE